MTPEAKRIAIAKLCPHVAKIDGAGVPVWRLDTCEVFDPLEDLNAMAEAEKSLAIPQRVKYCDELVRIRAATVHESGAWWAIRSTTAAQCADAFLLTMGLMKEGES